MPEHECENIIAQKRLEQHSLSIRLVDNQWLYEAELFSSQKLVYDGEADHVGQLIRAYKLYIRFCPECGKDLSNPDTERLSQVEAQGLSHTPEVEEHFCPELENYNQEYPYFGSSPDDNGLWKITLLDDYWILDRHVYVTEQRLNENKLLEQEEIGSLHFEFGFGIVFCPFCGEYLGDYHLPTQNE